MEHDFVTLRGNLGSTYQALVAFLGISDIESQYSARRSQLPIHSRELHPQPERPFPTNAFHIRARFHVLAPRVKVAANLFRESYPEGFQLVAHQPLNAPQSALEFLAHGDQLVFVVDNPRRNEDDQLGFFLRRTG